ncbi:hypothetical protein ABLA30_09620 [Xenorhabdus nematophila]|uniref:hypothetical protein n=1 Tax=Xenorhabdus nematophila TaxID=628 RepID=UPI0032B75837
MTKIDKITGSQLMRLWGVPSWVEPGAEYYLWEGCCVFALVKQDGFYDIHIAMDKRRRKDSRIAGAAILKRFGNHKLRAAILVDREHVCHYAAKMGFSSPTKQLIPLMDGSLVTSFIMWREPGDYYG